jgi:hypothetical protein
MEKTDIDIITDLRSKEEGKYYHLLDLIEIIDNNITKEINNKIQDSEINKQQIRAINNEKYSELKQKIIFNIIDDEKEIYINWKNIIWSSLFLSIYGNFESKINQICLFIKDKDKIELSLEDLRGSGLIRAKKYLYQVAKYNFPITEDNWQCSEKYNKIRNILAHNEGRFDKNKDKELCDFIKSKKIFDKDKIVITKDFTLETGNLFYNIYLALLNELVRVIDNL